MRMSGSIHLTAAERLAASQVLVVKVGSALLCDEGGSLRADWLATLAGDIHELRNGGRHVLIVSSGAIAVGRTRLGLNGPLRLEEKQAASAAGQAALIGAWQAAFDPFNIPAAQVLLTLDDTEHRRRYLNARAALTTLFSLGAAPVINENDTVATSEIRYGDNDRLAAHTAQLIRADTLVILSDVDGLYSADPRRYAQAEHIAYVEAVTPAIEAMATGANLHTGVGSGGMASKIAASKIAGKAGCATIIAPGAENHPLAALLNGGRSTLLAASKGAENARRQWIAGRLKASGVITIDEGAAKALRGGASLLPAGVTKVEGEFARGDAVSIAGPDGVLVGQGLCTYDSGDVKRIAGARSERLEGILGYRRRPAVVEKDELVLHTEQS